jgi:hypothetical protein
LPSFPSLSFIFQEVLVANVRLSRQSQILSDEIATAQRLEDLSSPFNRWEYRCCSLFLLIDLRVERYFAMRV